MTKPSGSPYFDKEQVMNTPLDDSIGQAFDDQSNDVPSESTEVVEEQKVDEVTEEAESPEPETTAEESFTTKPVDLNALPSELQEVYKDWQRAYTQKRQAEKAELAELRAELERRSSQTSEGDSIDNLDDENLTPEERVRLEAQKVFQEEQEKMWADQARKDYLTLDDRLNDDLPNHDPYLDEWLQNKLDAELEAYQLESGTLTGFDYKSKARELISQWDDHVDKIVKGFVQKQRELTREKADKSKKHSPDVSVAKGQKAQGTMGLEEAIESAFDES